MEVVLLSCHDNQCHQPTVHVVLLKKVNITMTTELSCYHSNLVFFASILSSLKQMCHTVRKMRAGHSSLTL